MWHNIKLTFVIMCIIYGVLSLLIFGLPVVMNIMIWFVTDVPMWINLLIASAMMAISIFSIGMLNKALEDSIKK